MDVADLVEVAPVQVDERARRERTAASAASTRAASDSAATKRPPRTAALVSPEPSKKAGPVLTTSTPARATASKTVSWGCHVRGSGPPSQDSSLSSRSSPGTSTS